MKQNVGKTDKAIRVFVAVVLAALGYYFNRWWLYLFSAAALITAIVGYCGLYSILGITTCPVKKQAKEKNPKKGKKK